MDIIGCLEKEKLYLVQNVKAHTGINKEFTKEDFDETEIKERRTRLYSWDFGW